MLKRLRLRNFKSFVDETVEFGPFTFVIGGNGAGKSNLFDALRFLRSIGEGRSVRDAIEGHALPSSFAPSVAGIRGGGGSVVHFASDSSTFSLELVIAEGAAEIVYYVEVDAQKHRVVNEELSASSHPDVYVFSTRPETGSLHHDPDSPVLTARFHKNSRGLNPRRDFSPSEFILSQFASRRAESKINEDVAELVRSQLVSITPLELQPDVLRSYSPLGRFDLGEHGENFAAVVWKLQKTAKDAVGFVQVGEDDSDLEYDEDAVGRRDAVVAWLGQVTPRAITSLRTVEAPTGEVIVAVVEDPFDRVITAPSLSDGTLRFAALAIVTVGQDGARTLVVEELENGINPSRIALLVQMIEQTVGADDQVQVIASTHSPSVLEYSSASTAESAVVIGWDDEAASSHVMQLRDLPGLSQAMETQSLGSLQAEGWLQSAAAAR